MAADGGYDWRLDLPGAELAGEIRNRVERALAGFRAGESEAAGEAYRLLQWRLALDLAEIPRRDRDTILKLVHAAIDAVARPPMDRHAGEAELLSLLRFLDEP